MPSSNCVICPIFSLSVISRTSLLTFAENSLAGGPAGVMFRSKKDWLSTICHEESSAMAPKVTRPQTTKENTILRTRLLNLDTVLPCLGRSPHFSAITIFRIFQLPSAWFRHAVRYFSTSLLPLSKVDSAVLIRKPNVLLTRSRRLCRSAGCRSTTLQAMSSYRSEFSPFSNELTRGTAANSIAGIRGGHQREIASLHLIDPSLISGINPRPCPKHCARCIRGVG